MSKLIDLIAYAIQPALGPLAGHARKCAWVLTIGGLALTGWFVAGFF